MALEDLSPADLETKLAALDEENRKLQARIQASRIHEIKLLEIQRMATAASWELDIATGNLGSAESLAALLGIAALDGEKFDVLLGLIHADDRGEFIREREHLQTAVDEAYAAKLIGKASTSERSLGSPSTEPMSRPRM